MSRIGKRPVPVPAGVTVTIDGKNVSVQGPKGKLSHVVPEGVSVERNDGVLVVQRASDSKTDRSLHGLTRTLVDNMVIGVTAGFSKTLEINGVGYRAQLAGKGLTLSLGFSHPVVVTPPEGISFTVQEGRATEPYRVTVTGIDKQVVGETAAEIRRWRKPEPYKGKGIKYAGEVIRRKAGKSGKVGGKKK
ncbi:MAG: ribosomal protein [Chloroflexi bacterium]|nr:ribosomal protein [Chloroflexota bacterium]